MAPLVCQPGLPADVLRVRRAEPRGNTDSSRTQPPPDRAHHTGAPGGAVRLPVGVSVSVRRCELFEATTRTFTWPWRSATRVVTLASFGISVIERPGATS